MRTSDVHSRSTVLAYKTVEISHNHSCHGNATMSSMCCVQLHVSNIHSKNVTTEMQQYVLTVLLLRYKIFALLTAPQLL